MAVRIRLRRVGATKQPSYRVVVVESRSPRDGRFIETIGHYNPLTDPATVKIDQARAQYWLSKGAQVTEIVSKLLRRTGSASSVASGESTSPGAAPDAEASDSSQQQAE